MAEINDLKNALKSRDYLPLEYFTFGRVGNVEAGQGYNRTQPTDQSIRVDEGATYTYVGYAIPGSDEASAVWKIKRITNANSTILYADGDPFYDNIWNNRSTTITYS